jgi:hypothetical protein
MDPSKRNKSKVQAMDMKLFRNNEEKTRRNRIRNKIFRELEYKISQ